MSDAPNDETKWWLNCLGVLLVGLLTLLVAVIVSGLWLVWWRW